MSEITGKRRMKFEADVPAWEFIKDPERRSAMTYKCMLNVHELGIWKDFDDGERKIIEEMEDVRRQITRKLEKLCNLEAQIDFIMAVKAGEVKITKPIKGVDIS